MIGIEQATELENKDFEASLERSHTLSKTKHEKRFEDCDCIGCRYQRKLKK